MLQIKIIHIYLSMPRTIDHVFYNRVENSSRGHPYTQPRPQGFSLNKWVGREKALASAGHVYSLNIPEKLIYMQPAGFALTEVERSNNGK